MDQGLGKHASVPLPPTMRHAPHFGAPPFRTKADTSRKRWQPLRANMALQSPDTLSMTRFRFPTALSVFFHVRSPHTVHRRAQNTLHGRVWSYGPHPPRPFFALVASITSHFRTRRQPSRPLLGSEPARPFLGSGPSRPFFALNHHVHFSTPSSLNTIFN